MDITKIVIFGFIAIIFFLVFCIFYLVFVYRKTLEKYYELSSRQNKNELRRRMEIDAAKFIDPRIDSAISRVVDEAIVLISKNAKSVVTSIKRKTVEKLVDEEAGSEAALAASFDEAKKDIEEYKREKFEEVGRKTSEILGKVVLQSSIEVSSLLSDQEKEKIIMRAIEDAKRSNIF